MSAYQRLRAAASSSIQQNAEGRLANRQYGQGRNTTVPCNTFGAETDCQQDTKA
jgi:hypothetical protein